jgi:integrase
MLPTPDIQPSDQWTAAWDGFELYLLSEGKAPGTIRNLRSLVFILARHATAAGKEPEQVTRPWLMRYLLDQGKDRKGDGKVTLHKYVKGFWSWFATEYGADSPMQGVPCPKGEETTLPPVLTPDQIKAVFKACKGRDAAETARNTAILSLLLESGIRREEMTLLDLADIDLKAGTVVIRRGKGGKRRVAAFGPTAAQDLWRWLRQRGPEPGPLFCTPQGGRLAPGTVGKLMTAIGKKAGVQLRAHLCRHTWTDAMKRSDLRDGDIMTLAGWSSTTMLQRYGKAMAEERALAAARQIDVGSILRGKGAA